MSVNNALAGVAVKDLQTASKWYEKLIGQAGQQPMSEVFEWSLREGGVLQIFEDSERAGSSSVTFSVNGLDEHVEKLTRDGIEVGKCTSSDKVSTAIVSDPDGNQIVLAEQHSKAVAK